MNARTLIVGDVHGCSAELDTWLAQADYRSGEQLVLLGDLVGKGPDPAGVVERAMSLGALVVLGNHDAHCLNAWSAHQRGESPRLRETHQRALDALTTPQLVWMRERPLLLRLGLTVQWNSRPYPDVVCVHAGVDPSRALDQQRENDLMNMRSIRPDGSPTKRIEHDPWARRWEGPELILFGHDAVRGLQQESHAIGLDTGCVYGGELSGAVIDGDSLSILSVPASQVWCPL